MTLPLTDVRAVLEGETGLRLAVLFGSRARGAARSDSDLDIGVVGVPVSRLPALETALGRAAGRTVDLVDLTGASPLLRFEIAREGRVLLEPTPHAWSDFRARAMVDWWDWAPTARIFQRAAVERLRARVAHGPS